MNKTFKRIASFVMAMVLTFSMALNVSAADSSISYEGGAEEFVFLPGSGYTDSDLFDGFKNVMPGDTLTEEITVTNNSTNTDYVKIYMRAETHDEEANPLTYSETYENTDGKDQADVAGQRDETVATMRDFLSQLSMNVYNGTELIFSGEPDELDGLAENVLLGSFYPGEETTLTVELKVPIELGNEYANRVGEVDWVFVAEEIDRNGVSVDLEAIKYLDGELAEEGAFEFELVDEDGNVIETVKNGANGEIHFSPLTFSDESDEGEHHYQIREKKGDNDRIIYDETVYDVTVDVTYDREDYKAETTITVNGTAYEGTPVFHNETIKKVGVIIDAVKLFNGVPALPGTFGFVMIDDHGKVVDMTANGLYGKIRFDELTFDEPGVYHYRIMEIIGIDPFVVYDATVYDVYVTVTPGEDGYNTTVTFKKNGLPYCGIPYFYNHTRTPAKVDIGAQKFLDGKFPPAGDYEFVLVDGLGNIVDTSVNDKYGKIYFKDQTFYAPGIYKYQIYEVIGTDEGIVYDDTQYEITYTVIPNLPIIDGYTVKTTITADGECYEGIPVFNNKTRTPADVELDADKLLDGAVPEAEAFQFALMDADGNIIETVANDATGHIDFSKLAFDKSGTYTYKIVEVIGEDESVVYDETGYEVTITVTANEPTVDGYVTDIVITKDGEAYEGTPLFNNSTRTPVEVILDAEKYLDGEVPEEGSFEFVLKDAEGNVVGTATNDAEGNIVFAPLTFDKAGTYNFTVSEIEGTDTEIIYDDTVYYVEIVVTANDATVDGYEAAVTVTLEDETPVDVMVFLNETVGTEPDEPVIPDEPTPDEPTPDKPTPDEPTPDEPDDETPDDPEQDKPGAVQTGDTANILIWVLLAGTMLIIITFCIKIKKGLRKDNE